MKLLVVIVNYRTAPLVIDCLRSLEGVRYPGFEAVVVDNGSTDGSAVAIQEASPGVRIIETGKNLGFAGGNNAGT
jgi:GT2 family glycosyltransferase